MKNSMVLVISVLLCALMLVVGFAPSYMEYSYRQNAAAVLPELEEVFLPPVAAAETPPLPENNLCEDNNCACACDCGCGCGP